MTQPELFSTLLLEGVRYTREQLLEEASLLSVADTSFRAQLLHFLQQWYNDSPYLEVKTSGSTGEPKVLRVGKAQMVNSARMTCSFLGLVPGEKALLCMPLQYIGAKMMVVRSLACGLDLWLAEPAGNPLVVNRIPDFVAMTPMQVYNTLAVPEEKVRLGGIGNVIIGGSAIDPLLEKELYIMPGKIWSTYGMTETVSHIALRRINGTDASPYYSPFPQVSLTLSPDGTLVIDAPLISKKRVVTNDIAELGDNGTFRVLGRKDHVINSGGIKIRIEELEHLIKEHLDIPFFVTSVPDVRYGEKVVLLTEREFEPESLRKLQPHLPRYWSPKEVLVIRELPYTGNGKPDRVKARETALQVYKK